MTHSHDSTNDVGIDGGNIPIIVGIGHGIIREGVTLLLVDDVLDYVEIVLIYVIILICIPKNG